AQFAGTILFIFALGALSLLSSVWARNTPAAILGVYFWGAAGLLVLAAVGSWAGSGALNTWLASLHPLYLLGAAWEDAGAGEVTRRLLTAAAWWGGLGALAFAVAAWRLRPAYARQLERAGRPMGISWGRPAVGDDPIAWKERYVDGAAPVPALRRLPCWAG